MENKENLEEVFLGFLEDLMSELTKEQEKEINNQELKENLLIIDKLTNNFKSIIERKETFDEKEYNNYICVAGIKILRLNKICKKEINKLEVK